ncbi:protein translocase subunit SecD [Candidatus Falkowbacteria bacterium]|nr:protein translocase subunit SecD [Candidatus Falkowbacteria bacterium]
MDKLSSRTKVRFGVVAILVVAVLLGLTVYPNGFNKTMDVVNKKIGTEFPHWFAKPFHLGLDLAGGIQLVYEADMSKIPAGDQASAIDGVRDVIERRVNALGVAEPLIQTNQAQGKWRIIVELPGVQDVDLAMKTIGETPLLEFKEKNEQLQRELTWQEKNDIAKYNKDAKAEAQIVLAKASKGEDFVSLVTQYSDDAATKALEGNLGYIKMGGADNSLVLAVEKLAVGTVAPKVVEFDENLQIVKLLNKRDGDKEIQASHILICYKGSDKCTKERTKEDAKKLIQDLQKQATPQNFSELAKKNSDDPGAANGGDLGWFSKGQMVPEFEKEVFAMKIGTISDIVDTQFGYHLIYKVNERYIPEYQVARILIDKKTAAEVLPSKEDWLFTGLTGRQLKNAVVNFDQTTGVAEVSLEFNQEGAALFAKITAKNVGKPLAIFLDGQPISAPTVSEEIKEGKARITGNFGLDEAKLLVQRLNAGALPVPIILIGQEVVGASLGSESVNKSVYAGLLGLLAVIIFMIFYYRVPGILASIALLVYGSLVLFLFKIIPITITLAGIAGIVMSIGMAVDANVLIFERLKEELRLGKPLHVSLEEAFKRAWPSIRDSNVSTLISCFVLAWLGTSVIKGFAITLFIGVVVSMFSAITVSRLLLKLFVNPAKPPKSLWWYGIKRNIK